MSDSEYSVIKNDVIKRFDCRSIKFNIIEGTPSTWHPDQDMNYLMGLRISFICIVVGQGNHTEGLK